MQKRIINYVKSGHPGLYIVSAEESRVEAELTAVAQSTRYKLFAWSITTGMVKDWNCLLWYQVSTTVWVVKQVVPLFVGRLWYLTHPRRQ